MATTHSPTAFQPADKTSSRARSSFRLLRHLLYSLATMIDKAEEVRYALRQQRYAALLSNK